MTNLTKLVPRDPKDTPLECPFCGGEHEYLSCDRVKSLTWAEDYYPCFDSLVKVEFFSERELTDNKDA